MIAHVISFSTRGGLACPSTKHLTAGGGQRGGVARRGPPALQRSCSSQRTGDAALQRDRSEVHLDRTSTGFNKQSSECLLVRLRIQFPHTVLNRVILYLLYRPLASTPCLTLTVAAISPTAHIPLPTARRVIQHSRVPGATLKGHAT